ncbi:MAG: SpoIIE family protein phosphatase [Bacteroidales bacterium]|nr:SpoIIE family protein phosphatase [Bacteroidales bacterium]
MPKKIKFSNLISSYFFVDAILGTLFGFFVLHPLSMFIKHNGSIGHFNMDQLIFSPMGLYFAGIGLLLGALNGSFRVRMKQKNKELEKSKLFIEEKNQKLEDSISYAKRIQLAALASDKQIKSYLPESFVLYEPKDIVSGDFYWFARLKEKIFVATIDCTGHGVPGALLTMIANAHLVEIVKVLKISEPDKILNQLHIYICNTLKQEESKNLDGLDIAICAIDKTNNSLEYSGARIPLVYIQDENLKIIKGDRYSIGGYNKKLKRTFTKHIIELKQDTIFYMFSDGYTDQFGGPKNRRFRIDKLSNLLLEIHKLSMEEQKDILKKSIEKWRDKEPQTDDILVMGFKTNYVKHLN